MLKLTMAELAIQELLAMSECAVCLSSATNPKILPCQHIFCLACLQGVYDQTTKNNPTTVGQLTCPLCSAVFPIHAGALTQLPCDFRTNQVTTLVENLQKATSAWNCVVCSKHKLDADMRVLCFDCAKLFCTECHTTHIANTQFRDHVYTSISNGLDQLYCAEHKDFKHKFCIDCTIGICQMCLLISHADHRVEVYAKSDGTPNQTSAEIARVKMKLNQILDQHRSICQREAMYTQTLKESIRKHKLDLIKKLDDGEHELFIKLDQELKQFQGFVQKTASSLEGALPKLERLERESQIIARPLLAAPNIKLTTSDLPSRRAVKEITSTPYQLHSPSKYTFTKAEGSLGSLHQISPISKTQYTLGGSSATGRETASVVQSYPAKTPEELSIQKGEIIENRMKSNDGWWVGDIRSSGQTSKTGWFPAHCVTVTSFIQQLRKYTTRRVTTPEFSQSGTAATSEDLDRQEDEGLTFEHETVTIVVKQGDITEETTDAIVNSTTSKLSLNCGKLSSYILKKGGKGIEKEWNEKMRGKIFTTEQHPIITTPGKLRCKYIIHADTQNYWELEKIIDRILQFADIQKVSSLALPALGLLQKTPKDVAKLMIGAIMTFASDHNPQYLELIHITLFDPDVFTAFKKETEAITRKTESDLFGKFTGQTMDEIPPNAPEETEPEYM